MLFGEITAPGCPANANERCHLVERESAAARDWLDGWIHQVERNRDLSFNARLARLSQLGVEVTVAKAGTGLPRYEIAIDIPIELQSVMRRDPESGFVPMSDEK